ncbi:chaperonin 10-like protein [Lipomyces starkeyi]|uniref:Enoyl reductase (ER) domain-containing protein n=1 Tax=Lipomyces starkeyi NRRL Y-11557 TaxID=675824 RepID=A0A1E3PXZ5_LIPST|nr:hypothetical protein LIPSTDRAFT_5746 [Lipomyces starkeyi NRRL Y-11557]
MKEAFVDKSLSVTIIDTDIPRPDKGELLINVAVAAANPKDWKIAEIIGNVNAGDDLAGIVVAVGEGVTEFKAGDRVAALHRTFQPHGSYAEYAIAQACTTFHIPDKTTFEEAATIPLAAMTAAVGLYLDLQLPLPFTPATSPVPLIVYGASTSVGGFVIKFARLSNIHPIIGIAGKGADYVETIIDRTKGDTIVDYRNGEEKVIEMIQQVIRIGGWGDIGHAFDAVSQYGSYQILGRVLNPRGRITLILPNAKYDDLPLGLTATRTNISTIFSDWKDAGLVMPESLDESKTAGRDFAFAIIRLISLWLTNGLFHGHPYTVVRGGLAGVSAALKDLKSGKHSATKFVFRIADTP